MKPIIKIDGKSEAESKLHKDTTQVDKTLRESDEQFLQRQQELEATAPKDGDAGSDAALPANQQHNYSEDPLKKKKNFDEKVYLFPEEFNALRRELEENWLTFFVTVNPELRVSPAWAMVHDAPKFLGLMNGALDMDMQLDTGNVAGVCLKYLNKLRSMRGVSSVH